MRKLHYDEISRRRAQNVEVAARHPVTVLLDNVRSLYNVGAMFRTSDAAWIEQLILTGITGTPANRGLHKTALGAQDTVPWSYYAEGCRAIEALKERGYTVAALEITDEPVLTSAVTPAMFPLCLVVGNELSGVQERYLALADCALEIPLYGTKQSLNAAVAFGIAIFDIVRAYRRISSGT